MTKHIPNLVGLDSSELSDVATNLNDAILARKEELDKKGRLTGEKKKEFSEAARLADELACELGYLEDNED